MLKSIIFTTLFSLLLASSFDTDDCENWYRSSWNSKPQYTSLYEKYLPNRCSSTGKDHIVKIALSGSVSNRLCTVLVDTKDYIFVEDRDMLDCFQYFESELGQNKKLVHFI